MKWIQKYWWIVLIVILLIILMPIGLNFILSYNTPGDYSVIGEPKDWLNFWVVYIGSIVGTFVSFFVLMRTIKSNHEENEVNRKENKQANEKNRDNQNKLAVFQVEINNLHLFKESCLTLLEAYSYNRFIQICNSFIQESKNPLDLIRIGFSDVIKASRSFLMNFMPSASKMNELIDLEKATSDYYNSILLDLEVVTSYLNRSKEHIRNNITTDEHASTSLALIIKKNITQLDDLDSKKWLDKILNEYMDEIPKDFIGPLWDLISKVYLSEKARIAKILEEDGTEQTK